MKYFIISTDGERLWNPHTQQWMDLAACLEWVWRNRELMRSTQKSKAQVRTTAEQLSGTIQ